ncbi:hypothetical protein P823_04593 [Klebsiella pneumoniae UCI 20]|nr:hypothetical protein [Klebsiella pneumoniae]EWD70548.1 hypothetical protein P823_04593 [Klebsiella pneumoniae UCI 20]
MLTKTKAAIVTTLFLSLGAQADTILNVATAGCYYKIKKSLGLASFKCHLK